MQAKNKTTKQLQNDGAAKPKILALQAICDNSCRRKIVEG